ncbi:MAG: hypothetical protein ACMG6H_14200, partial [Acidobacteriota bacterium]
MRLSSRLFNALPSFFDAALGFFDFQSQTAGLLFGFSPGRLFSRPSLRFLFGALTCFFGATLGLRNLARKAVSFRGGELPRRLLDFPLLSVFLRSLERLLFLQLSTRCFFFYPATRFFFRALAGLLSTALCFSNLRRQFACFLLCPLASGHFFGSFTCFILGPPPSFFGAHLHFGDLSCEPGGFFRRTFPRCHLVRLLPRNVFGSNALGFLFGFEARLLFRRLLAGSLFRSYPGGFFFCTLAGCL